MSQLLPLELIDKCIGSRCVAFVAKVPTRAPDTWTRTHNLASVAHTRTPCCLLCCLLAVIGMIEATAAMVVWPLRVSVAKVTVSSAQLRGHFTRTALFGAVCGTRRMGQASYCVVWSCTAKRAHRDIASRGKNLAVLSIYRYGNAPCCIYI